MLKAFSATCLLLLTLDTSAQFFKKPVFSGIYFQWGYSRDRYSKSDLHLSNGNEYNFTLYDAKAVDQPDFKAFYETPLDITIPQNVCRLGVYLNESHTHAIELNFDHAKYVVPDTQSLRITGYVKGEAIDMDTIVQRHFVHIEHTNGANFLLLNYVGQKELWRNKKRVLASAVWKAGGGIVIPKSYMIVMSEKLDNDLRVAGYIFATEAGLRFYPFRHFFLEATVKGGYANYLNAVTVAGGRLSHSFYFGSVNGTIGYDINLGFLKKGNKKT